MSYPISEEMLGQVVDFHGHSCPGLAIGIRAAETGLAALGYSVRNTTADLVSVVETDMCGVDAIQFLTGCTFGKGNLIHRDYGKMAFSFFDRKTDVGVRLVLNPEVRARIDEQMSPLLEKIESGTAEQEDEAALKALREALLEKFMTCPAEEMFFVKQLSEGIPRGAQVLISLRCEHCDEMTMESRTRRMNGQTLCIPCFNEVEQKK